MIQTTCCKLLVPFLRLKYYYLHTYMMKISLEYETLRVFMSSLSSKFKYVKFNYLMKFIWDHDFDMH